MSLSNFSVERFQLRSKHCGAGRSEKVRTHRVWSISRCSTRSIELPVERFRRIPVKGSLFLGPHDKRSGTLLIRSRPLVKRWRLVRGRLATRRLKSLKRGVRDTIATFLVSTNPACEGDVAHPQTSPVLLIDLLLARRRIEVGHYLGCEHTKRMSSLSPPRSICSLFGHGALQTLIV